MRKEKEGRSTDVPLCNKHYRTVHRQQNEIVCFSCGRKLQRNVHRPINVQALQRGVLTDANQTELGNARICDSCHAKQIKADTSNYTSDAALDKIIAEIKDEISAFNGIWCSDNCVHQAKAVLTAHLAEKLRSNEGTLLSDLFHEFNKILTMHGREVMTKSLYLLTHFEQKLGKHLQVVYVKGARRPGYLLLRSGCDLHHALFCALADKKKDTSIHEIIKKTNLQTPSSDNCCDELDSTVFASMNEVLHEQAHKWAQEGKQASTLTTVDFNKIITNTNPRLWNMMTTLTKPKRQATLSEPPNLKAGQLPKLFILAALAHMVHSPCHYPLHLPLSDYTDAMSGSADLLQTMSRLGICSSRDTLQRLKTTVVLERHEVGMQKEVATGAFSITSIDNIDRAAPGRRITPGNQSRGFHGTSIQHVAPKPISCILGPNERPAEPLISVPRSGVFSSLIYQENVNKLMHPRTIREGKKSTPEPIHEASSGADEINVETIREIDKYRVCLYRPPQTGKKTLTIRAIELSEEEETAIISLQEKIFTYMVNRQKQAMHPTKKAMGLKDQIMEDLPELSCEKSAIFTLGVLPDQADNKDALKALLDTIHDLYGIGTYQTHHLVVGDQKLFSGMHQLKRQYGADLDWLLPYPGDWHVLKNYQPVLMKLYFHSGLRELAIDGGYRGSNLTGLETCSNFKHTHIFFLEAFQSIYCYALKVYLTGQHAQVLTFNGFQKFMKKLTLDHQTPTLWLNMLNDIGMYVMFWLSLRCTDWAVRMGTFKGMA